MSRLKRYKTEYPSVYYVLGKPLKGAYRPERIYYIRYKRNGQEIEEKAGRQVRDNMNPAKAGKISAELIDGKRLARKEIREQKKAIMLYLSKEAYHAVQEAKAL